MAEKTRKHWIISDYQARMNQLRVVLQYLMVVPHGTQQKEYYTGVILLNTVNKILSTITLGWTTPHPQNTTAHHRLYSYQ